MRRALLTHYSRNGSRFISDNSLHYTFTAATASTFPAQQAGCWLSPCLQQILPAGSSSVCEKAPPASPLQCGTGCSHRPPWPRCSQGQSWKTPCRGLRGSGGKDRKVFAAHAHENKPYLIKCKGSKMGHSWAKLQNIAASDVTCCKSFSSIHPVATGLSCRLLPNQSLIRLHHILAAVFYVYSILITAIDTEAVFEWNVTSQPNWVLRERRTLLLSLHSFQATETCFWCSIPSERLKSLTALHLAACLQHTGSYHAASQNAALG